MTKRINIMGVEYDFKFLPDKELGIMAGCDGACSYSDKVIKVASDTYDRSERPDKPENQTAYPKHVKRH